MPWHAGKQFDGKATWVGKQLPETSVVRPQLSLPCRSHATPLLPSVGPQRGTVYEVKNGIELTIAIHQCETQKVVEAKEVFCCDRRRTVIRQLRQSMTGPRNDVLPTDPEGVQDVFF
jgi:hypothetical protein